MPRSTLTKLLSLPSDSAGIVIGIVAKQSGLMSRLVNLRLRVDLGGTTTEIADFVSVWQVGTAIMVETLTESHATLLITLANVADTM